MTKEDTFFNTNNPKPVTFDLSSTSLAAENIIVFLILISVIGDCIYIYKMVDIVRVLRAVFAWEYVNTVRHGS